MRFNNFLYEERNETNGELFELRGIIFPVVFLFVILIVLLVAGGGQAGLLGRVSSSENPLQMFYGAGAVVDLDLGAGGLGEPVFGLDKASEGSGGEAEGAEHIFGFGHVAGGGGDDGGAQHVGTQVGNLTGEGEAIGRGGIAGRGGGAGKGDGASGSGGVEGRMGVAAVALAVFVAGLIAYGLTSLAVYTVSLVALVMTITIHTLLSPTKRAGILTS